VKKRDLYSKEDGFYSQTLFLTVKMTYKLNIEQVVSNHVGGTLLSTIKPFLLESFEDTVLSTLAGH
jgi:hypothetical protein